MSLSPKDTVEISFEPCVVRSLLYDALMKDWKNIVADIIEKLNDSTSYGNIGYLGYILVNLTSIANIRCILCEKFIRQLLPLVDCNTRSERCLIAIDILRNLCFESRFHSILLDENDEFLSTLLKPIADVNDNLNDNEIEKLPLQLQYYEGHRSEDPVIIDKIIESLYQLCRSEIGLKTLRIKGVYALLREFDRASLPSILILRNNCIPSFNENNITDDHSQSEMHDQQDLQVGSEGAELQEDKYSPGDTLCDDVAENNDDDDDDDDDDKDDSGINDLIVDSMMDDRGSDRCGGSGSIGG
ncbi:hypothetical protein DINM_001866 [Dirofilaria immitis]|nr:hypothetical protein [Dirofilaria immitis]